MTQLASATMPLLYALEPLRRGWIAGVMAGVTWLGDGVAFALLGILLYWCWDKRLGEYLMAAGLAGVTLCHGLKNLFRVPRPWLLDEQFSIVEAARARAAGYSFPSGHSQMGVTLYGGIALWTKRRALRALGIALAILVPFSRMALGVHTVLDILVGAAIALAMLFWLRPAFQTGKGLAGVYAALSALCVLGLILSLSVRTPGGSAEELYNEWESIKATCQSLAGILALWLGREVDRRYTNWSCGGSLPVQIVKGVLGIALFALLRGAAHYMPQGNWSLRLIAYFIAMAFGTTLWPMSFAWLRKKIDKEAATAT